MPNNGDFGPAQSNDVVPNGPIVSLPNLPLPGTLVLATYESYGKATVLNMLCSGTFSFSTVVSPTTGVAHAAAAEVFAPVNGAPTLFIQGSGTLSLTLYTKRNNVV